MPESPIRLHGVTARERHEATRLVRRAVGDANGWITDFRQFSNFAAALDVEVSPARLPSLYLAIEAVGIRLSPPLVDLQPIDHAREELLVALRIDFLHDDPDLALPVPSVPG